MQARTNEAPIRMRDVRRFRRKVLRKRKAPGMKSSIILVEDQSKGYTGFYAPEVRLRASVRHTDAFSVRTQIA
jgi:hypothetical protein